MPLRLDSLDLTLDTGSLPTINKDRLIERETTDPQTGVINTGWYSGEPTGLHGFDGIAATPYSVSLRLTAQAMGNSYTEGISRHTLDDLCARVSSTGLVELTPDHLLDSTVRRADPFADVRTDDLDGVPGALRLLGRTMGAASKIKGRGDAVTLYHTLPDQQGVFRVYPKGPQMSKAKHKEFRELYPQAVKGLDGHHRWELQTQTYHASRRLSDMAEGRPMLKDLLSSERCPVADAIDALLDSWDTPRRAPHPLPFVPNTIAEFLHGPQVSPSEHFAALGIAHIVGLAEGDFTAAKEIARAKYGGKNVSRLYAGLRSACEVYGQPLSVPSPQARAVDVLRTAAARVREREAS